jgi:hypothetical protein
VTVDFDEGQHVRVVNPETGAVICSEAVIVPRPFYSTTCEVWVLMHHDELGLWPRDWLVAA